MESILEEYRTSVGTDSAKARQTIKKLDYKEDFYLLQCIAQTYLDESRFEDDGQSNLRIYFDKRKWKMAEKFIIKAFKLNSDNADVLYTMASIRKLNNQDETAAYCFEKIIKLGIRKIAHGEYGRGIPFAKELINDSRFELYRLFYETNPSLSKKYLSIYKKELLKGVKTIFKPLKKFLLD